MADEPVPPSGKRFSTDLRAIREDRGVSIDEVHGETRIARTLIESFEDGRLYNHPNYNRVYLRSFVRAYAQAIGISSEVALDELESALAGDYEDALLDKYESVDVSEEGSEGADGPSLADGSQEDEASEPTSAASPEDRGGIVGPPRVAGEDTPDGESQESPGRATEEPSSPEHPEEGAGERSAEESTEEESPARPVGSGESPSSGDDEMDSSSESEGDAPSWLEEGQDEVSAAPSPESGPSDPVRGEDEPPVEGVGGSGVVGGPTALGEEDEGTEAPSASSGSASTAPPRRSRSRSSWSSGIQNYSRELILAGIGLTIGLVVVLGLSWIYSTEGDTQTSTESTEQVMVADTASTSASTDTATASSPPPPIDFSLGETLHLTVMATSNVRNIRIRRDNDLRRPYWIQEGEAEVFPFERRVILQNELDDVQLYLEGYPYPMPAADTFGGFEITRSEAEAFTDTLRGEPPSLSVTPDTTPVGSPFNIQ